MFRHPLYPFMLADVDYFVRLPDGETAILEIKTTNYNATDAWWQEGREIVPPYYEAQGRHYMAACTATRRTSALSGRSGGIWHTNRK